VEQRKGGNNFPLHKYIQHGLNSQALLFNLIGPLLTRRAQRTFRLERMEIPGTW
jgi:hypothetical protein